MIRSIFREAEQPKPIEKVDRGGTVKWGKDNLYSQFLVGLKYANPVHGGIINQKVKFITAGGVETLSDELFKNGVSPYNYYELAESAAQDFEIFDGVAVIYKKNLNGMWDAYPADFEMFRQTENGMFLEYSDDWSKSSQNEKTGFKRYKSIFHIGEEDKECVFYNIIRPKQRKADYSGKDKSLTANYYPTPNYGGAITQIMAGIEMDYFTYSEAVNGYKGGTVISLLNGVPDSLEEENKVIRRIKDEATDRDTQGGITVLFADGKDRAPEINQMSGNDLDKRYIETSKESTRKIMIAHGVISPALFGVLSETLFGSKEELTIAYKLFQENYAKSRQSFLEETFNYGHRRLNKSELGFKFNEYVLTLEQNVEEVNRTSAALNGMSPLVANKVLSSLTINEIRALASLTPIEGGDALPTDAAAPSQFSEQADPVAVQFESVGVSKDSVHILDSRAYTSYEDNEGDYKQQFFTERFDMVITDDDRNILQMIKNGESYDAISKAIGKGGQYLSSRLFKLTENAYIDGWEVTPKGIRTAATLTELEVMYSYEERPNAPALLPGGKSRAFCERMLQLNKLYTRQEIEMISSAVDRDVWSYRGGWYHNPDTNKNTPSCRHLWNQVITVRR